MATQRFAHARQIDAPVGRLWDLTVDIEAWPRYTPTMRVVSGLDDGPLRIGSRARITQPGMGSRVWTIVDLDERRRFAWETALGSVHMVAAHELRPMSPETCEQILSLDLRGLGAGLVARLAGRRIQQALEAENNGFAAAAAS